MNNKKNQTNTNQTKEYTMSQSPKTETNDFVTMTTAKGHKYNIPKKYETQSKISVSAVIRAMAADGMKPYRIHKVTGIRAQHAYNVLSQIVKS